MVALLAALPLTACGIGGMTSAMRPAVDTFERGECLSREIREGVECETPAGRDRAGHG